MFDQLLNQHEDLIGKPAMRQGNIKPHRKETLKEQTNAKRRRVSSLFAAQKRRLRRASGLSAHARNPT